MNETRGMSVAWLWLAPLLMILLVILVQWLPLMASNTTAGLADTALADRRMDTRMDRGPRPYSPLELRGRDIYLREGCSGCHTRWVRLVDSDRRRYGEASQAGDFAFERPVQWGLRRYGPDLSDIGGKYPSAWHRRHLMAPRTVVMETTMPAYPWLAERRLSYADLPARLRTLRQVGLPYSLTEHERLQNQQRFCEQLSVLLDIHRAEESLLHQARLQNDDGDAAALTELDALIAYIQVLGVTNDHPGQSILPGQRR